MRTSLAAAFLGLLLSSPSFAQDGLTTQALGRIEKYEALEAELQAGDTQKAKLYLNQIGWAAKRLAASSDKNHPVHKDAVARYEALKAKIEAKAGGTPPAPSGGGYDYDKLVALNKDIANAIENLKILSVKHLNDANRVGGLRRELADFKARLAVFPADDANVQIVQGNYASFKTLFDAGMAQLNQGKGESAAVLARVKELQAKYASDNRPKDLVPPFDEGQIRAWAQELRRFREQELPTDLAWLAKAAQNPAIDPGPIRNLHNSLSTTWTWTLDGDEKSVRERISSDVERGQDVAAFILETDISDRNQVLQRILGKGAFDENMQWLREGEHAVAMARVYDDAMGSPAVFGPTITDPNAARPKQPDRDAQAKLVENAIVQLKAMARQSLDAVRMPKAASTDPGLLKVAAETLRSADEEITGWERMVINLDKSTKVRREAWIRPGTVSATLSYYEYVWDEFQVTTAEKVGDEVWLFSNRFKLYKSGDPTTPVDRWILSQRFELTPILAEHVHD